MPKVKLELNEPLEGVLKYAKGKHYDSTIPTKRGSMMYSLASGDVIFLDEDICDEPDMLFADAHVAPGDPFRLTLRKRNGQRYYELHKLSDAAEPAPAPTKLESQLRASIDHANAQRVTPSQKQPAAPAAPVQKAQPTQNNAPAGHTVASALVASALIAAIDGLLLARDYAHAKGLPFAIELAFNAEDVRALAATTYIQACKSPAYQAPDLVNGGTRTWPQ